MATQKRFVAKNGLDNNSNSIINVADPTNAQDVATKSYVDGLSGASGTQRTTTTVIPTVGQTVFTIAYTAGFIDVFYNGIKLILADDFVATNGTSVTLTTPTISGDVVEFVTYLNVALANTYTQPQANALFAPIASPTFTGTVSGITAAMVGLGNVTNTSDTNKPVSTATQTALDLKAPLASPTFTGTTTTSVLKTVSLQESKITMSALDVDISLGNYFTKTITAISTLTVSNVPITGTVASFILDLTNGGAFAITWWANMKWASGTAPTLTASGRDLLGFFTHDAGTTWNGLVLAKDIK